MSVFDPSVAENAIADHTTGIPMEINRQIVARLKKEWPWLDVQTVHRNATVSISHPGKTEFVDPRTKKAFAINERSYPCAHLIEVSGCEDVFDELFEKIETVVLTLISDLEGEALKEAAQNMSFYLCFSEVSFVMSDDGDGWQKMSTSIAVLRIKNDEAHTVMNGVLVPLNPPMTEEDNAAIEAEVEARNRQSKIEALANFANSLTHKLKIVVQCEDDKVTGDVEPATRWPDRGSMQMAANALRTLADVVAQNASGKGNTYTKITPDGIEHADANGTTISVQGFDKLEIEVTTDVTPRTMLHLTIGDEEWQPTQEEFSSVVELFRDAKFVNNAVVVTTPDVKVHPSTKAAIVVTQAGTEIKHD